MGVKQKIKKTGKRNDRNNVGMVPSVRVSRLRVQPKTKRDLTKSELQIILSDQASTIEQPRRKLRRSPRNMANSYLSNLPELVLDIIFMKMKTDDQLNLARSCVRLQCVFYGLGRRLYQRLDLCDLKLMSVANIRLLFESSGQFMKQIYGALPSRNRALILKLMIKHCIHVRSIDIYNTTLRHNSVVHICTQFPPSADVYLGGMSRTVLMNLRSLGHRLRVR